MFLRTFSYIPLEISRSYPTDPRIPAFSVPRHNWAINGCRRVFGKLVITATATATTTVVLAAFFASPTVLFASHYYRRSACASRIFIIFRCFRMISVRKIRTDRPLFIVRTAAADGAQLGDAFRVKRRG